MTPTHYTELHTDEERTIAWIAGKARRDTIDGGAGALTIARRLDAKNKGTLAGVVSDVYAASIGRHHPQHEAWECPECGIAHLGREAAAQCCQEGEETES